MLLGTLLRRLQDERFVQETLLGLGDVTLARRVADGGARFGESAADYAAGACARFSDGASDEDWLALMTALERGSDPAATCLRTMIDWSLKQDAEPAGQGGCTCGGGCGEHDHGPG